MMRCHPGHRYWIGGSMDGQIDHLVSTTASDYPLTWWFPHTLEMYERNLDGGTDCTYRLVAIRARMVEQP